MTSIYEPGVFGAGASFPSGHTAMAMVACVVPFYLARIGRDPRGAGLLALSYGGTVAIGRVVAGAHYATDVIFSFGLGLLLAPLVVRWTAPDVRHPTD